MPAVNDGPVRAMRRARPKHTHLDTFVDIASDRGFGATAYWV
jgi:hypothetical protein